MHLETRLKSIYFYFEQGIQLEQLDCSSITAIMSLSTECDGILKKLHWEITTQLVAWSIYSPLLHVNYPFYTLDFPQIWKTVFVNMTRITDENVKTFAFQNFTMRHHRVSFHSFVTNALVDFFPYIHSNVFTLITLSFGSPLKFLCFLCWYIFS